MLNFSVLLSLYHQEQPENLRQCLTSLREQTVRADEIIIVFDGTISPELENIVHDFQAALPIHIFRLPHNVGLGKALNIGIQHCTHEWIFRMDTDDIAVANRFALQTEFLAQHPHVQLLGGQISEFDDAQPNKQPENRIVPQTHDEIIQFSKKRNPFNHMTVAYRKTAVQAAGGYQHHWYMEDYNLWLRMLANGVQAANLPDILVHARTGAAMLQRRRGWQYMVSEWQLCSLKRRLNVQNHASALYYFILRTLPRLLPTSCLKFAYRLLRKS
ncbi:glycosyltransferase [Wielerella bovis]|uniref:glycosyltransferase n=1 Tax=Wielerella bovis TaxID=2917790 RepID=UPI002018ED27|nr:glycosyltransferase [Wielerella bovis]ULJ68755.1 glycosyltransferase [Wielerella bovis]